MLISQNKLERRIGACPARGGLTRLWLNLRRYAIAFEHLGGRMKQLHLPSCRACFSSLFSIVHNSYLYTIGGQLQIMDSNAPRVGESLPTNPGRTVMTIIMLLLLMMMVVVLVVVFMSTMTPG